MAPKLAWIFQCSQVCRVGPFDLPPSTSRVLHRPVWLGLGYTVWENGKQDMPCARCGGLNGHSPIGPQRMPLLRGVAGSVSPGVDFGVSEVQVRPMESSQLPLQHYDCMQ